MNVFRKSILKKKCNANKMDLNPAYSVCLIDTVNKNDAISFTAADLNHEKSKLAFTK